MSKVQEQLNKILADIVTEMPNTLTGPPITATPTATGARQCMETFDKQIERQRQTMKIIWTGTAHVEPMTETAESDGEVK